jgi:hypothetical protein
MMGIGHGIFAQKRELFKVQRGSSRMFAELLKRRIREAGLLEKNPSYYMYKLFQTLALLALSVAVLALTDRL